LLSRRNFRLFLLFLLFTSSFRSGIVGIVTFFFLLDKIQLFFGFVLTSLLLFATSLFFLAAGFSFLALFALGLVVVVLVLEYF
jgi:hypothetical protein